MDIIPPRKPIQNQTEDLINSGQTVNQQTDEIINHKQDIFDPAFLNYMKDVENDKLYIHGTNIRHVDSVGNDTIGYGHLLTSENIENNKVYGYNLDTLTEAEAQNVLVEDLKNKNQILINKLGKDYTNLDSKRKQMLLDIQFNVSGGIDKFPNFTQGVLDNDMTIMQNEYTRVSQGKPLTRRNNKFKEFFFDIKK